MPLPRSGRGPILLGVAAVALATAACAAAEATDLQNVVRAYADAMIRAGRDTYGEEQSPLFAAALERRTMQLPDLRTVPEIPGVRPHDRSLTGGNPWHDAALYGLLQRLSRRTGDPAYAAEADRALAYFMTRCASPKTRLLAWGEHLTWDFHRERATWLTEHHEVRGEWPYWDACYRLAPQPSYAFALAQWDHQIFDKATGDFSRHARYAEHGPEAGADFPRYAGQLIVNWADAVSRGDNASQPRREELVQAIDLLVRRMDDTRRQSPVGQLAAFRGAAYGWTSSNLELARCLWKAADMLPAKPASTDLPERMRRLAVELDDGFHRLPHAIGRGGGFVATFDTQTATPMQRDSNTPFTDDWGVGYGVATNAALANLVDARFEQLREHEPKLAERHRRLVEAAADRYLEAAPNPAALHAPESFAEVIELLLRVHRRRAVVATPAAECPYLARAAAIARIGIGMFLTDGLPLPRATNKHDHYEALTGGPALMAALFDLDAALQAAGIAFDATQPSRATPAAATPWPVRAETLRRAMREDLGLPERRVPLDAVVHRRVEGDGHTVECVSFAGDPGLRITAACYLPSPPPPRPVPAIVVACGHGGSKSAAYAQYAGQLYAKLGFVVVVPDTIGEEERDHLGRLGGRGHDLPELGDGHPEFVRRTFGRPVLGRIVQDLLAAVDYATGRPEVDAARIGLVGYSLGGTSGGCAAILDERIRAAVISGWVFSRRYTDPKEAKWCTVMPYEAFFQRMDAAEMTALLAPHCATLFMLGDRDAVIDKTHGGAVAVRDLEEAVAGASRILDSAGVAGTIASRIVRGADHRPFFLSADAADFLRNHLDHTPVPIPEGRITFGAWSDAEGVAIESLYATVERERGLEVVEAGVRCRRPEALACFPNQRPPREYTMQGWIDACRKGTPTSPP
jgi:dienelactone hydrolase